MPTRRRTLRTLALGSAAAAGTLLYTFQIGPHHLALRRRTMPLRGLRESWWNRRLVQISDLHAGHDVDDDFLRSCLKKVAGLAPDIVVITGDFMTCHDGAQIGRVLDILGSLPSPPHGVYATLGNHDYGAGWASTRSPTSSPGGCKNKAWTFRNRCAHLPEGLDIIGMDDLWASRFDPQAALAESDPAHARIALSHNPDTADLPGWEGFASWILSGHTHGGQCKPPFLPPPLLPVTNTRYQKGLYDLSGGRTLHINSGLGHLLKVRFNCRPEITAFTLRPTAPA